VCEEAGDYEGVREDLEALMPGASAHGSFAMALVQREQEWASDCARCGVPILALLAVHAGQLVACLGALPTHNSHRACRAAQSMLASTSVQGGMHAWVPAALTAHIRAAKTMHARGSCMHGCRWLGSMSGLVACMLKGHAYVHVCRCLQLQKRAQLAVCMHALKLFHACARCRQVRRPAGGSVLHRVGQVMMHAQYGYRGVIYDWTHTCQASQEWILQMNVDALPGECLLPKDPSFFQAFSKAV
jgi:hypothetical protein